MLEYNPKHPLLSIHIPKSGGTSFYNILQNWYGKSFKRHYYQERFKIKPWKYRLKKLWSDAYRENLCIHGHFNHQRGFGIEDYYPEVSQYITIMRDPLELQLSNYRYVVGRQNIGKGYRNGKKLRIEKDIDTYLLESKSFILLFFPKNLTAVNYKEVISNKYIHIGITENYQYSVDLIAGKLGKPKMKIPHENKSKKTTTPSEETIRIFKEKHQLEYLIYNYAVELNSKINA